MRYALRVLITAVALALGISSANAASTLVFRAVTVAGKHAPVARIHAGSTPIMTLSGRGWKSVEAARDVANRLNGFAEEGLRSDEISIWSDRKTRTIMARGEKIVTIDKTLAKSQGMDRTALARTWASNLRAAFGRPYLSAEPLLVPVGETRALALKGSFSGQLSVKPEMSIVTATWDKDAKVVRIAGLDTGRTDLIVQDSGSTLRVPVRAARYAARLVESLPAEVTGTPAFRDDVDRAVTSAVGAGMLIEPNAWTEIRPLTGESGAIWPGKSQAVPVEISAGGPDYLPYHDKPTVVVRNEPVTATPAKLLMVSNSPERIRGYGLWFEGTIGDFDSIRLLYHHVNGLKVSADLVVELWNIGQEAARVQVVAGAAGPSFDEAWVGHRAAGEFLGKCAANSGWIVPIPASTTVPILSQRLSAGSVASGVLEMRSLGKANLSLRLYLESPVSQRAPRDIASYAASPLLGQWHYPQTRRTVKTKYEVGRDWAFVTIGDQPVAGLKDGDLLEGSYGVLYEIDLELSNPTSAPARVVVSLEPAGGPARGALLIDGRYAETALLKRDDEGIVARYSLAPGEVRKVHIETMPQGGSNYPVRLVARPI